MVNHAPHKWGKSYVQVNFHYLMKYDEIMKKTYAWYITILLAQKYKSFWVYMLDKVLLISQEGKKKEAKR